MNIDPTIIKALEYIFTGTIGAGIFSIVTTLLQKRKDKQDREQSEANKEKVEAEAESIQLQSARDLVSTLREEVARYRSETVEARNETLAIRKELEELSTKYNALLKDRKSSDAEIARLTTIVKTMESNIIKLEAENKSLKAQLDEVQRHNGKEN